MCLAVPMRLCEIDGVNGVALSGNVKRQVRLDLVDAPNIGDYVLVHAGFAIQVLDEKEAKITLEYLNEFLSDT